MVVEEKMTFEDYLKTIESELYEAIAALEGEDLARVRQCSARAQSASLEAWREQKRIMES